MERKDSGEMKTETGQLKGRKDSVRLLRRWEGMEYREELEDQPQATRDRSSVLQKGGGEDE